jgi:hypothetical protein
MIKRVLDLQEIMDECRTKVYNDIPDKVIVLSNPARPSRWTDGTLVFKPKK